MAGACSVGPCPDDATLEVAHLNGVTERYCGRHGGIFRWPRRRFKRVLDHWERWSEQDEVRASDPNVGTGS